MEKIISVVFNVESEGYQAMTELKNAPIADNYTVSQAALIKKENGAVTILDSFDTGIETSDDTAIGGIVGSLVGIIGGPLGMLLGGSLGLMTGSIIDSTEAVSNASILERVTEQLIDGEVAIIALEQESEAGAAAKLFSKFDVTIVEDDAAEVAEEVQHAIEVQMELEREARRKLREEKKADFKQKVEEQKAKIKADFEARKAKREEK